MAVKRRLSRGDREAIRLRFFREFRGESGCASVGVRKDKVTGDSYLHVGISNDGGRLPTEFEGLAVRTYKTSSAIHAVQYAA